jgi:hypothetical protein
VAIPPTTTTVARTAARAMFNHLRDPVVLIVAPFENFLDFLFAGSEDITPRFMIYEQYMSFAVLNQDDKKICLKIRDDLTTLPVRAIE